MEGDRLERRLLSGLCDTERRRRGWSRSEVGEGECDLRGSCSVLSGLLEGESLCGLAEAFF